MPYFIDAVILFFGLWGIFAGIFPRIEKRFALFLASSLHYKSWGLIALTIGFFMINSLTGVPAEMVWFIIILTLAIEVKGVLLFVLPERVVTKHLKYYRSWPNELERLAGFVWVLITLYYFVSIF
ncbi:MAG: hypothetical protein COU08_02965 [Candidatus Harrisonbacteria bacterium CG10_big_fil_rev_8_21_14_0_10_42_17]|uniref:Uncharacterized protein n=1 Tax=Candidatus Harrisonbacteria bacterium CG10_big_fil_rev_8_21_14_0_10_42_17 TaxID=1974584 RepID=A0A2M6WHS8_9BACT|nr:MAG: hypothetical protein COU08_02965 [Candidatus Harrisonbacteria bacterium CG10_big_fil_rev_8_21_14_0_10_42_17]